MNIKTLMRTYPAEKPTAPIQLVLLGIITACGLAALFFAAFASFKISTGNVYQAFFAAILIEVGLAVEAMALIKRPRSFYPWAGLIVAFSVSGAYNWYQASAHTLEVGVEISTLVLVALAFGPLSALAAVSLTFGNEMREHQNAIAEWQKDAMEWAESERKRLERKQSRAEKKKNLPETPAERKTAAENLPVNLPETAEEKTAPDWLTTQPASVKEFKALVESNDLTLPPGLTGKDLTVIPAVKDDRTGRNWLQGVGYRNNGKN